MLVQAVRAGVFTTATTGLAVSGHHLASGHSVPWRAVLLAAMLLFGLALCTVRWLRSLRTVLLATGTT
ncbi:hypothetical protein [Streptomyces sp. NPDC051561]|uniref:hypothetical protein n=1 Tax=Streptomyces sp. NPDC051561 TaxID=3365658 RepID=UPI003793A9BE